MRTPPPFADYVHEPSWQVGLEWCDEVVDDDIGGSHPELMARYLRWLTGEVRLLSTISRTRDSVQ